MTATRFNPGPDTLRLFRDALGRFGTGITVVTCHSEKGPLGITANSFAAVSLDPPLVLWSPARASRRFEAFARAEHYAIHVLSDDQLDVGQRFSGEGFDFEGLNWTESETLTPLIEGALACFECTRHAAHDGGDHAIIVGRVTRTTTTEGTPVIFAGGKYGRFEPF